MALKFSPQTLQTHNYPTPFLLTDVAIAQKNLSDLLSAIPGVVAHYALKSNPDPEIIKALYKAGSHFEIASPGELELLNKLGVKSEDIIYSNPVKAAEHIAVTAKKGVNYFSFDSENELQKITKHAAGSNVYLRMKVPELGSTFPLSSKFGALPTEAVKLMRKAAELGLNPVGITFHVGSQSTDKNVWDLAIKTAGKVLADLQQVGLTMQFLDMGGGLPVTYDQAVPPIGVLAAVVNKALKDYLPYKLKIYVEPGRFLSANTSVITASVIAREKRDKAEWLYTDMGVFQGLMECLEMPGWALPIYTDESHVSEMQSFVLTGPTCDPQDTIGYDIKLPKDMAVGDRVYIGNAGAYTLAYAAPFFNGFAPPVVHYVKH